MRPGVDEWVREMIELPFIDDLVVVLWKRASPSPGKPIRKHLQCSRQAIPEAWAKVMAAEGCLHGCGGEAIHHPGDEGTLGSKAGALEDHPAVPGGQASMASEAKTCEPRRRQEDCLSSSQPVL